jgi:ComF family protein
MDQYSLWAGGFASTLGDHATSFFRLIFPRICPGCHRDLKKGEALVCLHCQQAMVRTDHASDRENALFGMFRPLVPLELAASLFFYGQGLIIQRLIQEVKYKGNRKLAKFLGEGLGSYLRGKPGWDGPDVLVAVPLHHRRQAKRGFNQSELICEGMATALGIQQVKGILIRTAGTSSQTTHTRTERWENMSRAFRVKESSLLQGRHILLVDDVVTTGATLFACSKVLMGIPGVKLSIATIAFAGEL